MRQKRIYQNYVFFIGLVILAFMPSVGHAAFTQTTIDQNANQYLNIGQTSSVYQFNFNPFLGSIQNPYNIISATISYSISDDTSDPGVYQGLGTLVKEGDLAQFNSHHFRQNTITPQNWTEQGEGLFLSLTSFNQYYVDSISTLTDTKTGPYTSNYNYVSTEYIYTSQHDHKDYVYTFDRKQAIYTGGMADNTKEYAISPGYYDQLKGQGFLNIQMRAIEGDSFFTGASLTIGVETVPEPGLGLLLGISLIGLVGVGAVRKIKQKKAVASS